MDMAISVKIFATIISPTRQECLDSPVPRLVALESDSIGFVSDLEALDRLSPRTADTVHLFYVRSGQRRAEDIMANVVSVTTVVSREVFFLRIETLIFFFRQRSSQTVHPFFLEFLSSLGWPVNVWRHPGWTGHVSTR